MKLYNHSHKIGNEGDLVKHAVLVAVLGTRAVMTDTPFVYAESHTGRATYELPENGKWGRGIGAFSKLPAVLEDRRRRTQGEASKIPQLAFYDDLCLGAEVQPGMSYPGSSGLVFRLLQQRQMPLKFHLWEFDAHAYADLAAHYQSSPNVAVYHGDGYAGVSGLDRADLVLVDPPGIDELERERILAVLTRLGTRCIPFICWTARLRDKGEMAARDSADSLQVHSLAVQQGWPSIGVSWGGAKGTIGCQLTISREFEPVARETVSEICQVMGWQMDW